MLDTYITGMGHFHPSHVIHSKDFNSFVPNFSADFVMQKTGIHSRRSVFSYDQLRQLAEGTASLPALLSQSGVLSSPEMAEAAWNVLRSRWDTDSSPQPDFIIHGAAANDEDCPAKACAIAKRLHFDGVPAFDLNAACSSFIYDLHAALALMEYSNLKESVVANVERLTTRLDYQDRQTCFFFGDGAAIASIKRSAEPLRGLKILDTTVYGRAEDAERVVIPRFGCFQQDGAYVRDFVMGGGYSSSCSILERNGLTRDDIDYFIGHQANLVLLEALFKRLELTHAQHLYNVDEFANQSSAGAPAVLSMNWDRFQPGDKILMSVFGAGMTWGCAVFECYQAEETKR